MALPEHVLTDEERKAFLDYVATHPDCSIKAAAIAAGIQRKDVKSLRSSNPEFEDDYKTARGYGVEQIMTSVVEEAIIGKLEPIVSAGKIVVGADGEPLMKRVRSERLLQTMIQGFTPEGKAMLAGKLGIEIDVTHGGSIELQRGVTFDEVARVLQAAGKDLPQLEAEVEGEAVLELDEPA